MIDSQRGAWRRVGYNHLISNKPEWSNCFIKNNHQISLKSCHVLFRKILSWTAKRFSSAAIVSLRGKKFQNFSCCADAYTYHICRAWYNGSYTMATKPIKFLELHYTMTQFLIINNYSTRARWVWSELVIIILYPASPIRIIVLLKTSGSTTLPC